MTSTMSVDLLESKSIGQDSIAMHKHMRPSAQLQVLADVGANLGMLFLVAASPIQLRPIRPNRYQLEASRNSMLLFVLSIGYRGP